MAVRRTVGRPGLGSDPAADQGGLTSRAFGVDLPGSRCRVPSQGRPCWIAFGFVVSEVKATRITRIDSTSPSLGTTLGLPIEGGPGRGFGVDGVGLAALAPHLPGHF